MENNEINENNPTTDPSKKNEGQKLQPRPNIEVNPGERGDKTEVDLDKEQPRTFPEISPGQDPSSDPGEKH